MFSYIAKYINNRIAYLKLEIADYVCNIIGSGGFELISSICILMALFMGTLAGGFLLGQWVENIGMGFLITMVIYLLFLIIFILFRKKIILHITNNVIKNAMKTINEAEE